MVIKNDEIKGIIFEIVVVILFVTLTFIASKIVMG